MTGSGNLVSEKAGNAAREEIAPLVIDSEGDLEVGDSGGSEVKDSKLRHEDYARVASSDLQSSDVESVLERKLSAEMAECRICQEEDVVTNLETPCGCSGSVKFAHRKCLQRWVDEKGNNDCEICHQPFVGYTAAPKPPPTDVDGTPIEFRFPASMSNEDWAAAVSRLRDPRLLAAERYGLDMSNYEDYAAANSNRASWCRSAALALMALLLLRHVLAMIAAGMDGDSPTLFTLFVLRVVGFLLPVYIMARALHILQRRRQAEENAMAAAEIAALLRRGEDGQVRLLLAPQRVPPGTV